MSLPKNWQRRSLASVSEVRTGIAKNRKELKQPITVPYMRVANVQDGHLDLTEVKTIQIEESQLDRYSLQYGDVLMTEGGDFDKLGRGDIWQEQISPCLHQNHVFAVRPNHQVIDSYFLSALSGSNYGKTYFLSCAKKSTNLASINSTQLKEFPVLIPPLPEQKKIATILATWDKAITTTEQLLEKGRLQKKALMKQLFFAGNRQETPFSQYRFKSLAAIDFNNLSAKTAPDFEFRYISLTDVNKGIINHKLVTHQYKTAPSRARRIVSAGDLLLATVRPNLQNFAKIDSQQKDCIASTGFAVISPNNGVCGDYLYHYLFSEHITRQIDNLVVGSSYPAINSIDVKNLTIQAPQLSEQQKIAEILTTADDEIAALQQKRDYFKQEKKALMQQLLTGQRRVKLP